MNRNTPLLDLTGNPTRSRPWGFRNTGVPIGMQVAGLAFDDATVLRAAHALERLADSAIRPPATPGEAHTST
jgi:Asp-tRNA(Asn)/Glu-tRNA(Gln) amidotransferase A subunit family amidase